MTPLHWIGDLLRSVLIQIPMPVARALFIAVPGILLIWVLRLPARQTTNPSSKEQKLSNNLKLWASLALVIQVLIYTFL
jgi:hypothetical protein